MGENKQTIKIELEAEEAGLEFIKAADKTYGKGYQNYKLYRFKECNHEQYLQPTHVRRKTIKCMTCFMDNLQQTVNSFGCEIIESLGFSKYKVRGLTCNHERIMWLGGIRNKATANCAECYNERLHKEATEYGVAIVGPSDNAYGAYRRYKLKCGHEITTSPLCIREGRYECKICGDNAYSCPSNLYLIKIETETNQWLKFGFSKNIDQRMRGYGLPQGCSKTIVFTMSVDNGYDALRLEKRIHEEMLLYRLDKKTMQRYHNKSGYTECYESDSLPLFLEKLERTQRQYNKKEGDYDKTSCNWAKV